MQQVKKIWIWCAYSNMGTSQWQKKKKRNKVLCCINSIYVYKICIHTHTSYTWNTLWWLFLGWREGRMWVVGIKEKKEAFAMGSRKHRYHFQWKKNKSSLAKMASVYCLRNDQEVRTSEADFNRVCKNTLWIPA